MTLIEEARAIFDQAYEEHTPVAVFLMTSGGKDSIVPLHLFKDDPRVTGAMHIDTGIRIPQVEDHVRSVCESLNLKLFIYRAMEYVRVDGIPDPQDYERMVQKYGFPGPSQHTIMYAKLKERQIKKMVREFKKKRSDRVMLVTGVRKQESRRRMGNVEPIQRDWSRVWVAPITNWNDEDMALYRTHYDLPISEVSKNLGMSGECLCGAYARPGELARIREFYPEVAERIERLERESGCPWGWEEYPNRKIAQEFSYQNRHMPLCTSCIAKGKAD